MTDWNPSPAELARIDQARGQVAENIRIGLARIHARMISDEWSETEIFRQMIAEFSNFNQTFTATYLAEAMLMMATLGDGPAEPF